MSRRIGSIVLALAAGVAIALAAPRAWDVAPFHGILLGSALYAGALRHGPGAFARTAAFLALAAAQGYVVFVAAPGADLRATFVILSTWIVLESMGGRSAAARGV